MEARRQLLHAAHLGPISPGNLSTGQSGNKHSGGFLGDIFNNPHSGSNHGQNLDFSASRSSPPAARSRSTSRPCTRASSTDTRVNEYGQRGPWEVAKDQSGTIKVTNVGPQDAKLTLSNNTRAKAFSKAMVYYHRIGDWADYPNMFNPFWRAKLQPITNGEIGHRAHGGGQQRGPGRYGLHGRQQRAPSTSSEDCHDSRTHDSCP